MKSDFFSDNKTLMMSYHMAKPSTYVPSRDIYLIISINYVFINSIFLFIYSLNSKTFNQLYSNENTELTNVAKKKASSGLSKQLNWNYICMYFYNLNICPSTII